MATMGGGAEGPLCAPEIAVKDSPLLNSVCNLVSHNESMSYIAII